MARVGGTLLCLNCGELGCFEEESNGIRITRKPEYYGIRTIEDWDKKTDEYLAWIRANKGDVMVALPELEDEWKQTCDMVRALLNADESA